MYDRYYQTGSTYARDLCTVRLRAEYRDDVTGPLDAPDAIPSGSTSEAINGVGTQVPTTTTHSRDALLYGYVLDGREYSYVVKGERFYFVAYTAGNVRRVAHYPSGRKAFDLSPARIRLFGEQGVFNRTMAELLWVCGEDRVYDTLTTGD